MSRFIPFLSVIVCILFVLLGSFVVRGQRPEPPPQPNQGINPIAAPETRQAPRTQRAREGTSFRHKHVFFRQIGDRTAMYTVEGNRHFICLENLHLERILATMQERTDRQFWRIDGEFTEFRGENFVIIQRAIVAGPPTPAGL